MITVISATNRPNNKSIKLSRIYEALLHEQGEEVTLFSLQELPENFLVSEMYGERSPDFDALLKKILVPSDKLVFVVPEYNGSIAGVLKVFLDAVHPSYFHGKKAALAGISSGFNGNLRGLEHLTGILHYLQVEVLSCKVKISFVEKNMSEDGELVNEKMVTDLRTQIDRFLTF